MASFESIYRYGNLSTLAFKVYPGYIRLIGIEFRPNTHIARVTMRVKKTLVDVFASSTTSINYCDDFCN